MVAQPGHKTRVDAEETRSLIDTAGPGTGGPPASDSAMSGAEINAEIFELSGSGSSTPSLSTAGDGSGGTVGGTTTTTGTAAAAAAASTTNTTTNSTPVAKQARRTHSGRSHSAPKRTLPPVAPESQASTAPVTSFLTHRRAAPGAAQHDADREAIAGLTNAIINLDKRSIEQQAKIEQLLRANGEMHRNSIGVEKAVLDRVEAAKLFMANDVDAKIGDLRSRFQVEFSDPARLAKHLAPVLKPAVDALMQAQMDAITHQFTILDGFMQERVKRDSLVQQYLANVAAMAPVDGEKINNAFHGVAVELIEIRAAALSSHGVDQTLLLGSASSPQAPAASANGNAPVDRDVQKISADLKETQAKLQYVITDLLQGKCHCVHVDQLDDRLQKNVSMTAAQTATMNTATAAITILQKSVEQLRSASASHESVPPPPTPSGEQRPPRESRDVPVFNAWASYKGTCGDKSCDTNHGTPSGLPTPPPGMPAGGDASAPAWYISTTVGGNGVCHCQHVELLREEFDKLKAKLDSGSDGWAAAAGIPGSRAPRPAAALPITMGPIGHLQDANARLFDDRIAAQPAFQFDGTKGGAQWKQKVERHMMAKVPALLELLQWAECYEGEKIDEPLLLKATVGSPMDQPRVANLNASIWGFLSSCVSGEAEVIFRMANKLQGLDAWRVLINFIDHGKAIQLESMRNDMKYGPTQTIKNLESVPIGIAQFELRIKEYGDIGGLVPTDDEKKSDLLRMLPEVLQNNLLWRATDEGSYAKFRDMIKLQSSRTLMLGRKLPVHAVRRDEPEGEDLDLNDVDLSLLNAEQLMAVIKRGGFKRGGKPDTRPPREDTRGPRMCPNCGEAHKELKCPKPEVARSDRKCWKCQKTGHMSRDCPSQKNGKPVKALTAEEQVNAVLHRLGCVTPSDGFTKATHTFRRPQPQRQPLTIASASGNRFNVLGAVSQRDRKAAKHAAMVPGQHHESLPGVDATPPRQQSELDRQLQIAAINRQQNELDRQLYKPDSSWITAAPTTHAADEAFPPLPERHARINDATAVPPPVVPPVRKGTSDRRCRELPGSCADDCCSHRADGDEQNTSMMQAIDDAIAGVMPQIRELGFVGIGEACDDCAEPLLAAEPERTIKVAKDSGACANVINPADLPRGVHPDGVFKNHFKGASDEHIEAYGGCETVMETEDGNKVVTPWQVCDVSRALSSVSQTTGPKEHPTGLYDVLFNNKVGVVVPAGIVAAILKKIKPIFQYERDGGLYTAEVRLSSFAGQGLGA